eukprot:jgi/Botrbrau1/7037/Bobra.0165s0060.1
MQMPVLPSCWQKEMSLPCVCSYQGWKIIKQTLDQLPQLPTLKPPPGDEDFIKRALRKTDPKLGNLLRSILNSAPGFLVNVKDHEHLVDLDEAGCKFLFLFRPFNAEPLERFNSRKRKCTTTNSAADMRVAYAFHGTCWSNIVLILQDGLQVTTGKEMHGKSMGEYI